MLIRSKSLSNLTPCQSNVFLSEKEASLLREREEWKTLHDSQLTELHSIIAELQKQLCSEKDSRIVEEEEDTDTDADFYFEDQILDLNEVNEQNCDDLEEEEEEVKAGKCDIDKLQSLLHHLSLIQQEHLTIKRDLTEKDKQLTAALVQVEKAEKEKEVLQSELNHLKLTLSPNAHTTTKYAKVRQNLKHGLKGTDLATLGPQLNGIIVETLNSVNLNDAVISELATTLSKQDLLLYTEKNCYKIDKLQNEVDYLLGRVSDGKNVNESLLAVFGKVESWGCGYRLAFETSEETIEAYDILVALLESELGLLLSNMRAAGIGMGKGEMSEGELKSLLKRAEFNRETAISAAKRVVGVVGCKGSQPNSNTLEKSIRSFIISLKTQTHTILSTVPPYDFNNEVNELKVMQPVNTRKIDLETAILLQELLSCREEKAELKMRLACVERERDYACRKLMDCGDTNNNTNQSNKNKNNVEIEA